MIDHAGWISQVLIVTALALIVVRLLRGPSGFDRLLAGETIALGIVGLLLVKAGPGEARFYFDAALGLALFSFVGTVLFARLLERGEIDE